MFPDLCINVFIILWNVPIYNTKNRGGHSYANKSEHSHREQSFFLTVQKVFQRLITHFYNICKKVTQGTNNADTEDKKRQKLRHIVNKLKHGKKLTAQEMEFLRMNYPDEYQHALRIQKMAEMLENQLKHAKSKQEADGYIAAALNGIPDDDPDKECLVASFQ